ncbi:hypothetical protein ACIHAA_01875 [Streptomyces sp. NPDC052040]|uniref:hypothetical protein n=1 Tax=Streptomyces sp. NPDC052040 TaxID=3365682 RepID=UPI0037D109BB
MPNTVPSPARTRARGSLHRAIGVLSGAAALAAAVLLPAGPAAAATATPAPRSTELTVISAVNLDAYCRSVGHPNAVQNSASASGWSCNGGGPVNITSACQYQYADAVAKGIGVYEEHERSGPTGWVCQGAVNKRIDLSGGLDLSGYCHSVGLGDAYNAVHNVDGWMCGNGGAGARIDLSAACRYQNPGYAQAGYAVVHGYRDFTSWTGIGCLALA